MVMEIVKDREPISNQACMERLNHMSDALFVLGGKWRLNILVMIARGAMRFNEIQRRLEGISPRMLSAELKSLELNGLIERTVDDVSGTVRYVATAYSNSTWRIWDELDKRGANHREVIKAEMRSRVAV